MTMWPLPRWEANPYDSLYEEASPKRCTFFRLQMASGQGFTLKGQGFHIKRAGKSLIQLF